MGSIWKAARGEEGLEEGERTQSLSIPPSPTHRRRLLISKRSQVALAFNASIHHRHYHICTRTFPALARRWGHWGGRATPPPQAPRHTHEAIYNLGAEGVGVATAGNGGRGRCPLLAPLARQPETSLDTSGPITACPAAAAAPGNPIHAD